VRTAPEILERSRFSPRRRGAPKRQETTWGSSALEWGLGLEMPLPGVLARFLMTAAMVSGMIGPAAYVAYPAEAWQCLAGAVSANLGGTLWLLLWFGRTSNRKLVVNPLTGLLGLYALRRLLGLIYVMGHGADLASPFVLVPTSAYIEASAKAEWVTFLGTGAFCVGWALSGRSRGPLLQTVGSTARLDRQLWIAYAIGLTGYLANWFFPATMARLGNAVTITSGLAYGAVFVLLAFSREYGISGRLRWAAYAAVLPLMGSALTSGMKSDFFFALLPVGAAHLLRKPGRGLALAAVGAVLLLGFVYPYVQEYRSANWGSRARGASVNEVASDVRRNVEQEGTAEMMRDSWDRFELRFGSVNEAGAVVYFADESGFMGSFFIANLLYGLVPRFFWPDKPSWDPSGWFTSVLSRGSGSYAPEGTSATALHVGPELYWMYGWPGTAIGMLLLGLFYRRVSDWLLEAAITTPIYRAAWYSFLQSVTFLEEVRYNAAVLSPLILLTNAAVVAWAVRVLLPRPVGTRARPPEGGERRQAVG